MFPLQATDSAFASMQKAPLEVVKAAYDASFKSVVAIILQSTDTSELQVNVLYQNTD